MVTVIRDPFLNAKSGSGEAGSPGGRFNNPGRSSYAGKAELDTRIPPPAKPILAAVSVNGIAIDEARIMAEAQHHPADNPGQALIAATKALVVRELLLQEARARDISAEAETLDNGSVETEEDALIRALIEREVESPSSNGDVRRRYYEHNRHRFKSETIYEARHILLAVKSEEVRDAMRKEAHHLIETLREHPGRFEDLAQAVSDCPSKDQGGNLGQLTTGSTVPEFEQVLEKMDVGQIWPEPVKSRFGFHVVFLVNKIPGEVLPFEHVEEKIGAWLEASSWSRAVSQYISILAGKAEINGIDLDAASTPLVQ